MSSGLFKFMISSVANQTISEICQNGYINIDIFICSHVFTEHITNIVTGVLLLYFNLYITYIINVHALNGGFVGIILKVEVYS